MARAIHTMIRVLDLDRSVSFYREALGLQEADRFDFDEFTLVYPSNNENDFEVELCSPDIKAFPKWAMLVSNQRPPPCKGEKSGVPVSPGASFSL